MKTIKKNLQYLIVAIGIVFVWRGTWGLADTYLFPNNSILSFVTSIIIGLTILFLNNLKKKDISELSVVDDE